MLMKKKISLIVVIIASLFSSCSKESGEGGSASIIGKVVVVDVIAGLPSDTTDAVEEDVYIIYGSDPNRVYDDSFETSWNGSFQFDFLRKGSYTVFVYSDDYPNSKEKVPIFKTIEVEKNGIEYSLEDIVIYK